MYNLGALIPPPPPHLIREESTEEYTEPAHPSSPKQLSASSYDGLSLFKKTGTSSLDPEHIKNDEQNINISNQQHLSTHTGTKTQLDMTISALDAIHLNTADYSDTSPNMRKTTETSLLPESDMPSSYISESSRTEKNQLEGTIQTSSPVSTDAVGRTKQITTTQQTPSSRMVRTRNGGNGHLIPLVKQIKSSMFAANVVRAHSTYINRWQKERLMLQSCYLLFAAATSSKHILLCIDVRTIDMSHYVQHTVLRRISVTKPRKPNRQKIQEKLRIISIRFESVHEALNFDKKLRFHIQTWMTRRDSMTALVDQKSVEDSISRTNRKLNTMLITLFAKSLHTVMKRISMEMVRQCLSVLRYHNLYRIRNDETKQMNELKQLLRREKGMMHLSGFYRQRMLSVWNDFKYVLQCEALHTERTRGGEALVKMIVDQEETKARFVMYWRVVLLVKALTSSLNRLIGNCVFHWRVYLEKADGRLEAAKEALTRLTKQKSFKRKEVLMICMKKWRTFYEEKLEKAKKLNEFIDDFKRKLKREAFYKILFFSRQQSMKQKWILKNAEAIVFKVVDSNKRKAFYDLQRHALQERTSNATQILSEMQQSTKYFSKYREEVPKHKAIHLMSTTLSVAIRNTSRIALHELQQNVVEMQCKNKIFILLERLVHRYEEALLREGMSALASNMRTNILIHRRRVEGCMKFLCFVKLKQQTTLLLSFNSIKVSGRTASVKEPTTKTREEHMIDAIQRIVTFYNKYYQRYTISKLRAHADASDAVRVSIRLLSLQNVVHLSNRCDVLSISRAFTLWRDSCAVKESADV